MLASLPGYFSDLPLAAVRVNGSAFDAFNVPHIDVVNVAVVLVRRLASGVPTFKYIGNRGRERIASETWSSSKVFCVADAGGKLGEACRPSVGGLDATTTG